MSVMLLGLFCHLEFGQKPCSETGACGSNFNVFPDDPRLRYEGYVHLAVEREGARMDRSPLGAEGSDVRLSNPGARITFSTNAHRIQAIVDYNGAKPCLPSCPRMADGSCSPAVPCPNQCELQLEVDGVPIRVTTTNLVGQELTHDHKTRDFSGEVKIHFGHPPDNPGRPPDKQNKEQHAGLPSPGPAGHLPVELPPRRTYTLLLPWGAPVQLKRLHLEHAAGVEVMPLLYDVPTPAERVKFTAYGDETTAGWCASRSYAQLLGQINDWSVTNLGVAGGRVTSEHGTTIGRQRGQIATIMLGNNEWDACVADVTAAFSALLKALREVQPRVPTAVITPTVSWREGKVCNGPAAATPEAIRTQISRSCGGHEEVMGRS